MASRHKQAIENSLIPVGSLPSNTSKHVVQTNPYLTSMASKANKEQMRNRNPFDSPNRSTSSLAETDDGDTSGQDEFHLERYSSNAKYHHLRQISRSTNGEEKEKKPDLNIITNFSVPKMPMKSEAVVVNEVPAKQVRADRRLKAISIVSHKAVAASASPPDDEKQPPKLVSSKLKTLGHSKGSKNTTSLRRLQNAVMQKQETTQTQRIPVGITMPKQDAAIVDQQIIDSALPAITPMTPAILVTPAGEQKPWVLQRHGTDELRRPASSIYSAMPMPIERAKTTTQTTHALHRRGSDTDGRDEVIHGTRRMSQESSERILVDSADTARPKSQGWWNTMLSPLLRAGSLASRKGQHTTDTPPVPPLPFSKEKDDSPALSARSDPSFLISSNGTSPETPRRQGLASVRDSTWSQWTEWEEEREANSQKTNETQSEDEHRDPQSIEEQLIPAPASTKIGLAAEYFHACAIEQLTGRSYFECVNHSCAEKLPKLYDESTKRGIVLASPFESPLDQNRAMTSDAFGNSKENPKSPEAVDKSEDLSPNELSPNVRQASIASVVKAKAKSLNNASDKGIPTAEVEIGTEKTQDKAMILDSTETKPPAPSTTTPAPRTNDGFPNIATIAPPPQTVEITITQKTASPPQAFEPLPEKAPVTKSMPVASPGPISPQGQKVLAPMEGVPLSEVGNHQQQPYPAPIVLNNYTNHHQLPTRPAFVSADTEYPPLPERVPTAPVTAEVIQNTSRRISIEERRQRHEKEDAAAKKVGGLWRGRGCFPKNGCMGRGGPEKRTKRRWVIAISLLLLAIIITCIVLALTLTRKGDGTPLDSQWLNLTGYPAMPIGILTIAAPNLVGQQKQCTQPTTMWSCSVPKENQDEIGSNESDQPNFRFEIKFRNGTTPVNMTIPLSGSGFSKTSQDPFTNDLFVANPPAPNQPDQLFIGQTTDNVTAPFDGEITPFYITFMSTFPLIPPAFNDSTTKRLVRRSANSSLNAIPAPALAEDGTAAPASLLPTAPFPVSQPIKLYNRGLQDEHYGFYMYYDKSIYLSGVQIEGNNAANSSGTPADADQDGGCLKSQAATVCTFSQTRFLFKAFTNPGFGASILPSVVNSNLTAPEDVKKTNKTSSATNFDRPGSFPYPASFVVDRHGGDIDSKAIYCYGMENGKVLVNEKILNGEIRSFGGQLVNAAPTVLGDGGSFNSTAGGIDGGTGGCFCNWQNWT